MPNNHLFAAYFCLVGIPILGLLGILDAGDSLRAPQSVGGAWDLEAGLALPPAPSCAGSPGWLRQPILIAQSGKFLELSVDTLRGQGELQNTAVSAEISGESPQSSCAVSLYLQASFQGSPKQDFLTGVIGVKGCPRCAPVPFRAVRKHTLEARR